MNNLIYRYIVAGFISLTLVSGAKAEREFWYNGEPCYLGTNLPGDNVDPNIEFENEEKRIRRKRERESRKTLLMVWSLVLSTM